MSCHRGVIPVVTCITTHLCDSADPAHENAGLTFDVILGELVRRGSSMLRFLRPWGFLLPVEGGWCFPLVCQPPTIWALLFIKQSFTLNALLSSLWSYRGFVFGSVKREFQIKYRNSMLGAVWNVVNPLAMILIYTVIFSRVMKAKLPEVDHLYAYGIYLCSGLLTWGVFVDIFGRGLTIFVDNAHLIKKLSFPRLSLPLIVILSALVNFAISFGLFLIFLCIAGVWPGWTTLAAIPVLLIELMLAVGLGVTFGVLNVFFRDVGQFFGIFLQFWFWLTPIVYPSSILPDEMKSIMTYNPMFHLISSYQRIFVFGQWPEWGNLVFPLIWGVLFCGIGLHLFRQHIGEMVDEL